MSKAIEALEQLIERIEAAFPTLEWSVSRGFNNPNGSYTATLSCLTAVITDPEQTPPLRLVGANGNTPVEALTNAFDAARSQEETET